MLKLPIDKKIISILFLIILTGMLLRYLDIKGGNFVFDYDQIEDQFYTLTIAVDKNPAIIGRAVYGDPRLHHGVFYYYYNLIPFLISGGNLFVSAYWNGLFNVSTGIVLFILSYLIFRKIIPGLIAAFIVAFSFEFIKFSNWLTIDTVAIFLVPLFYLGLWGVYLKKRWSYFLLPVALGLCIQSDLSLLYLIPVSLLFLILFRIKLPELKIILYSLTLFLLTISSLILTEIKLGFAGVKYLTNFSENFHGASKFTLNERLVLFSEDFFKNFSNNLFPSHKDIGMILGILVISAGIYFLKNSRDKNEKTGILFLLFYLFSPTITLVLGYHDTPWFLIGLSGAIALTTGFILSKIKPLIIITTLVFIGISNFYVLINRPVKAYQLFDRYYDPSSYLAFQLDVIDYTYRESRGKPFAINSVTYPLYYNAMWAYLYNWYGKEKYGYKPSWLGGEQIYPYNLLDLPKGNEENFYMIISDTERIPKWEKDTGKAWGSDKGKLIEEKISPGFIIQKFEK